MDVIIDLAQKLSSVGLAALLLIVLYGSKQRIWRWGKDFEEMETRHRAEKQILTNDRDWWRDITLRTTGLLERQGQASVRIQGEVVTKIDELNRKLLGGEGGST